MQEDLFDKTIKSKLSGFEKTPPAGIFEKIKDRLENSSNKKPPVFVLPSFVKYGTAASLAFLCGLLAMNLYLTKDVKTNNELLSGRIDKKEKSTAEIIFNNEAIGKLEFSVKSTLKEKSNLQLAKKHNQDFVNNAEAPIGSSSNKNGNSVKITKSQKAQDPFLFQSDKVQIDVAGAHASYQNYETDKITVYALAVFQNRVDNGLEMVKVDDEYTNTRFEHNKNYSAYTGFWFAPNVSFQSFGFAKYNFVGNGLGLDLGYDFTPAIGIQTGIKFNRLLKDFNLVDSDGSIYNQTLNYSNVILPLSLKLKKPYFAPNIERPVSLNGYVGIDYARMLHINKNTFGAHIGMEYDIFVRPEMLVSFGARAGLSSIMNYEPSEIFLQNSHKRYNYNLGVYAALRFIYPK
jgi:hypothetical protein